MNLKMMFGIGLVSFGVAFAQDATTAPSYSEQQLQQQEEQAASSESLTAPVPFVAPEIPKESRRTPFNAILHGKAYNKNNNMAAANNTDLLLRYPNLFANRKFFYIEPTNKLGIVSLGSFFTAFDISKATYPADDDSHKELGRLTLGYAAPGFGFYVRAGLGRDRVSNDGDRSVTVEGDEVAPGVKSKTYGGDDWAAAIAKGFLGLNIAAEFDWLTTKTQTHEDPAQSSVETKDRFDSLTIGLSLTNAPTAKNFTWTLGARFISFNNERKIDRNTGNDDDGLIPYYPPSYWSLDPYIRGGLSVLENENARVLIGTGAAFSYRNYDKPNDKQFSLTAVFLPSMMGEVFVGESKNLMFFGEVSYDWVVFRYLKNSDEEFSKMMDMMDVVNASIGFRYQYKDFLAVELGLEEKLFSNPGSVFQDTQTLVDFSAMVRF